MYYKDDEFICSACSHDLEENIPRFIAMDGNFSHKCEKHCNIAIIKSKEMREVISTLWVDPESVVEYSKVQGEKAIDPLDSNFGANNNPLKTRKRYPVIGVFGAACARHEIVLKITDITTAGERYMYPLAVINQLLKDVNSDEQTGGDSPQLNIMYDIICKLGKSLKEHFSGLMQKSKIAVPVFHSYAHVQHCQVKTNPRYRDGFGLTDGECLERLWSSLNRYVAMTRGMHQYNRQIVLYRVLVNRNKEKKDKMGLALEDKLKVALKMKSDLEEDLKGVSDSDIRSAELKWKEHVDLVNRSSSYAAICDVLPAGLDERTRYMVLLSFEYRILSQNTEEDIRNDPDLSDIKEELVEIRNEMKMLEEELKKEDEDFEHPTSAELIEYYADRAKADRDHFLEQKKKLFKNVICAVRKGYVQTNDILHSGHIGLEKAMQYKKRLPKIQKQINKLLDAYNAEFNENVSLKDINNKNSTFWNVEIDPLTLKILEKRRVMEELTPSCFFKLPYYDILSLLFFCMTSLYFFRYCLQSSSRFYVYAGPILLIICMRKINQDIQEHTTTSRIPGISSYFCIPWAEECFIIYEDGLSQDLASPLNPLVALGIFFRNRSMTIIDHPHATDPTIQYLYTLLLHFHQIDFQNIANLPAKLINSQIAEYDKIINLANTLNQPVIVEAVNESKSRINATKTKYKDYLYAEESSSATVPDNNDDNDVVVEVSEVRNTMNRREAYEAGMKFVDEFKQKRDEKAKRMDWIGCLKEGKQVLKYKNVDSLQSQYSKYCREKNKK